MRALLVVCLAFVTAHASAGAPPPPARATSFLGPFKSPAAYCAERGGACDVRPLGTEVPPDRTRGELRAARFIRIDDAWHVVIQTPGGWYGRHVAAPRAGSELAITGVSFFDLVGDSDEELYFELVDDHESCACENPPRLIHIYAVVCRIDERGLSCSDPALKQVDIDSASVVRWTADWIVERDGRVKPSLRDVGGLTAKERRQREVPFKLHFD